MVVKVVQNERRRPKTGTWNPDLLSGDDPKVLCNADGKTGDYQFAIDRHPKIYCPVGWHWVDDWHIEGKSDSSGDNDGWSYALDWDSLFGANSLMTSCVRQRTWIRTIADMALEKEVAQRPSTKQSNASKAAHCADRVSAGKDHFLVLGIDGDVYSLGDNSSGQCMQLSPAVTRPMRVNSLRMQKVLQVECGARHSLILMGDGTVHAAGDNSYGQCGVEARSWNKEGFIIESLTGRRINRVAAGNNHSLFMSSTGEVLACGDNSAGQLAAGSGKKMQRQPRKIKGEYRGVDNASSFVLISAGADSSAGVTASGTCYTWGSNSAGALGRKGSVYSAIAVETFAKHRIKVSEVAIGSGQAPHTVFIDSEAQLWSCGGHDGPQNGHQVPADCDLWMPKQVKECTLVTQCSAGYGSTMVVTSDYELLGTGDVTGTSNFVPVNVGAAVLEVAIGGSRSLALNHDGAISVVNVGGACNKFPGNTYLGEAERDEFDVYDIVFEGKGCLSLFDGDSFSGDFLNGMMHGEGTYTNAGGDSFTGYWWMGELSGSMQVQYANGDTYSGTFKNWIRDGVGKWTSHLGDSYDGEWDNGDWHGHGVHTFEDGSVYEGQFVRGVRHGDGKYTWHHGQVYEGQYVNGEMCGYGYLRTGAGNEYVGEMQNNCAVGKGTYKWNTEPNKGDLYYGEWQNNNMDGEGIFVFAHGGTYIGGFRGHKKDTRVIMDEDGDGTMEHQPGFLRMPNGDKFAVLFEDDEQITMDPIDDKRQQLENAEEEEKAMEQKKAELEEEIRTRSAAATTAREASHKLKQQREDAVKARAQAMLNCSQVDGERKRFIERSEKESDTRMNDIISLEADFELATSDHDYPKQQEVSDKLDEKRVEHKVASQKAIDQREDYDEQLEAVEREERRCKEAATSLTMEEARVTEDSDVKIKKARQVDMHCQRTEQLRIRAQLRKEFFSYWIEETKYRDVADEEAHKRDFALDRQAHIKNELVRREAKVASRKDALEEQEELKDNAKDARDECAQQVLKYGEQVDECREETLARHDNDLEAKLIQLKKEQEGAVDNLDYAEKELDRRREYERAAMKALEKAADRKTDAERRWKAAGDEAGACELRRVECIDLAEVEEAKRKKVSDELFEAKQVPLVEVPTVAEKVLEPKVMVGRSTAQRHWSVLKGGVKAAHDINHSGADPTALSEEEQLIALNEVVDEELEKVHMELVDYEDHERSNTDAKRWKMKYKYKYYYKYKAEAEEEVGVQQSQVLGDMWDIDPAVADVEAQAAPRGSPSKATMSMLGGGSMGKSSSAMLGQSSLLMSPPQLGRGDLEDEDEPDSPNVDQGQVEFFLETEEISEAPVKQVVHQSKRQASHFLVKVHEVGLQNKEARKVMIPQQRGMKNETEAWKDLLSIVVEKGAEETKAALRSKDVKALTSNNIMQAVTFLTAALEANLAPKESPMAGDRIHGTVGRPDWDSSKTPEGRYRYLKRLDKQDSEAARKIQSNPTLKSPEKVGWDHDKYYKTSGVPNPSTCISRW